MNLGTRSMSDGLEIYKAMIEDTMQSIRPELVEAMENYKVRPGGREAAQLDSLHFSYMCGHVWGKSLVQSNPRKASIVQSEHVLT